ncbi:MAG: branched-chain amino acid ABC transporter permease [Anaerolineae bacterium]
MSVTSVDPSPSRNPLARFNQSLRTNSDFAAIFAVVYVLITYLSVHVFNYPTAWWFPLASGITFPLFAISPFVILGLKFDNRIKIFLFAVIAVLLMPVLGMKNTFYLELATQIGIYGTMAIGLNIVVGFAGLLDLGYIAFFAVGAYLWGVFSAQLSESQATIIQLSGARASPDAFYLFLFIGVLGAAIAGILLGLPVLRLRGDYLAIVTLGFGEVIRILVSNLGNVSSDPNVKINLTNGTQGLSGITRPPMPQVFQDMVTGVANLFGLSVSNAQALTYQIFFYALVLIIGGIAVLISARLDSSPIGRAWTAIREDEIAAQAMGVPKVRMKLLAFAIGASFSGAMGVVFASKQQFVSPESFSFNQSIFVLVIVIVGGMGSIRGVLLGAVLITLLNLQILKDVSQLIGTLRSQDVPFFRDWPVQLDPARFERLVFGILLVLMMIFRPSGVLPAKRRQIELLEEDAPPSDAELKAALDAEVQEGSRS